MQQGYLFFTLINTTIIFYSAFHTNKVAQNISRNKAIPTLQQHPIKKQFAVRKQYTVKKAVLYLWYLYIILSYLLNVLFSPVDDLDKNTGSQLTLDDLFQRNFQIHEPDAKWISGKYVKKTQFMFPVQRLNPCCIGRGFGYNPWPFAAGHSLSLSPLSCHF